MVNKVILLLSFLLLTCSPADISTKPPQNYKSFKLDSGIFTTDINVIISSNVVLVSKILEDKYDIIISPKDLLIADGYTFSDQNVCVMWLRDIKNTAYDKARTNHELFHITAYILDYHGVKLEESSEEVFAYELDHLTEQFYNNYER